MMKKLWLTLAVLIALTSLASAQEYDVIIRGGTVYDGSGNAPLKKDVGIKGDRVAFIGDLSKQTAPLMIDASGMAVAPGFINMLSHSMMTLVRDPRSMSEIKQGITTEVFGESTPAPVKTCRTDAEWCTEWQFLEYLQKKGITPNVASYISASTLRVNFIGNEDKPPTPEQMDQIRKVVRDEMEHGILGIGSALIYPPAFFAKTEELIEMCKVASEYKGKYISHMRSEGNHLLEAVDELIRISREAKVPAEIYHLKASGVANWPKMDKVIAKVNAARKEGLKVSANMYTYQAGGTGLAATLPPWTQDGGVQAMLKRIADPATRQKILTEMRTPTDDWEQLYMLSGAPDKVILASFSNEKWQQYNGKTIADLMKVTGKDAENTILDLLTENNGGIGAIYFLMSEDNIKKQLKLPWVSFGSDAGSIAAEGNVLRTSAHPRTYGNFARLLGKYVREEKVITLQEAIRRLSNLPATNLGLDHRGMLKPGYFADVVIFDPNTVADKATFEKPHQYSVGIRDVLVNGVQVLKGGEHTGKFGGRALWGPGKVK